VSPATGPRSIVVFGGSSGIGLAAARRFSARGDRLVLAARGEQRLARAKALCEEAGARSIEVVPADVNDAAAVDAVVGRAEERFGEVDVVVHAGTVMAFGALTDVPPAVWERVVDTSLHGTANVARSALAAFGRRGRGTLVVVTSLLGQIAVPQMHAYITAKWGQRGLIEALRLEVRDEPDIHVCAVAPGSVDTPIFHASGNYAGSVGNPPPPVAQPDRVARRIVACADRPRRLRSVGPANPVIRLGYTAFRPLFDVLVGPMVRRLVLSGEPVGPTDGNVFAPTAYVSASSPAPPADGTVTTESAPPNSFST
jgi:NAD(P)-dependent dehydrogenase (short-subunit alcohol dehydrogenase family)